jgi:glucose/arabinose dehydrogenase
MRRILLIAVFAAVAGAAALLALAPRPGDGAGLERGARAVPPPSVALVKIAGTFDQPVYVAAPPGDAARLFVVEKTGRIRIVKDGAVLARPFLDLSGIVSSDGERGVLSVAFDPRYASNRRFYVDYTNTAGDTRVVRYTASAQDPNRASAASRRVLLRIHQPYSNHNGGQLQFGPDGRLYVGMGDGGSEGDPQGRAQDPHSRLGKMLRLSVGTSPVNVRVYAKGLRNPWRFSFDRKTGALWIGDVGQNKWEEVDYLKPGRPAGANLGWNGYEGTHVYDAAVAARLNKRALTWPVSQYSHSLGEAVTGGYVYRGGAIPSLRGLYVFGDFGSGRVWVMKGPSGTPVALPGADRAAGRISSFGEDAAGELYVVDIAGAVYRIAPAP